MGSHYELDVTVVSAKNLKNVNWKHGSLRPYAVLWVDPATKCSTKVDVENDDDPVWEEKLTIPLPPHVPIEDAVLSIDVVHADAEEGVKPFIGSARLALREVVEEVGIGDRSSRTLKLKRPSGRPHGKLELSVCVRDQVRFYDANAPPPYGVPYGSARDHGYGVPPPIHSYQYGAPPPPGGYPYGAPPPVSNYGYGAPPQPGYSYQSYGAASGEEKKGKMGMGAGLAIGVVAGVVGGVALAEGIDHLEDEIAEDAAEKVEEDMGYSDDF